MHQLSKFDTVLKALDGFEGVKKITGAKISAISNWRARGGKFPAKHFLVITDALAERNFTCARSLFTFKRNGNGKRKAA